MFTNRFAEDVAPASDTRVAPPRRRALLVANHHARRVKDCLDETVHRLSDGGLEVYPEQLRKGRTPADLIGKYRDQIDLMIVAGGDGTFNAVVDALVGTNLPLGILPLGTANDLARTLNIPADLEGACDVIAAGHMRPVDLGWVNGKHFFNVASLGLSATITQELTRDVKKRWGVFAYLMTAIRALRHSRPFHAQIRSGESEWDVKTVQIAIGNGRYYGGGMAVAEDAAIDDQQLDLYSLEVDHWWQMIPLLRALRTGTMDGRWNVRTLKGGSVEIHTRRRRAISTDGEITTHTPAVFRVIPQAIQVFAPPRVSTDPTS